MKKVLIFGDSLVQGLDFESSFKYQYHVESYPGFLAKDLQDLLKISINEDTYDFVVICCGVNDLGHGYNAKEVVDSLLTLQCMVNSSQVIGVYLHPCFNTFNEFYSEKSLDNICFCDFFYNLDSHDLDHDEFYLTLQGKQHFVESLQDCIENI